jgi:SAM-dependent methyltransferase
MYAWDHYGDLDPKEAAGEARPGTMLASLETGLELAGALPSGPVLDAGCSVGRSAFALAEHGAPLVLGVDLNFAMLRLASEALRHGVVRYPRRRAGLVYERREFPARFAKQENVDFWACDAMALPFPPATFSLAASMNLLDCVRSPRDLLLSLAQVLRPGGKVVLSCPYDWSAGATPVEAWLGGHSQRAPLAGSCGAVLRTMLTPSAHPGSINTLKLIAERDNLPWHVRLHERSTMAYKVHLLVAEKVEEARLLKAEG